MTDKKLILIVYLTEETSLPFRPSCSIIPTHDWEVCQYYCGCPCCKAKSCEQQSLVTRYKSLSLCISRILKLEFTYSYAMLLSSSLFSDKKMAKQWPTNDRS